VGETGVDLTHSGNDVVAEYRLQPGRFENEPILEDEGKLANRMDPTPLWHSV
jgi:hypothetical protein